MKESKDEKQQARFDTEVSTCERVENRIHDLMDLRQPLLSDQMVRQHVSKCDSCAELVVDFGALNDSLSQIPLATIHRLSGLQVASEETQQSADLHPVSFVVSIACLLLVILTSGIWFSQDKQTNNAMPMKIVGSDLSADDFSEYVSTAPAQGYEFVPAPHNTLPATDFINAVSFEQISGGVEPFQGYIDMTADLPGIRPVTKSVNATFHLIRFISEKPSTQKSDEPSNSPDVGCSDGTFLQLCMV